MSKDMPEQAEQLELDFKPIRGFPELRWAGKRPFRNPYYYPAQLKEQHGEADGDGWRNQLYWGDNLQVMAHLVRKFRGQVKLVYIDPPYDSKADYKKTIELRGKKATNDRTAFEEKQYGDIWVNDEYLQFMYERLVLLRGVLADDGAVYVHLDSKRIHHMRCIADEVFGPGNYRNEIIWAYKGKGLTNEKQRFPQFHGTILCYGNGTKHDFTPQREDGIAASVLQRFGRYLDDDGCISFGALRAGNENAELEKATRRFVAEFKREPEDDDIATRYEGGALVRDVWTDIPVVRESRRSVEYQGYPTQKPEALLARIIRASSKPGDIVFDAFMGSGTTQAVAMKLGRRFLGCDINKGAIDITTRRLLDVASDLRKPTQAKLDADAPPAPYTAFDVYTVNNYDLFRNEIEGRKLLADHFGIDVVAQPPWDGVLDDRHVKFMPINCIATRANLNEIIERADVRRWEAAASEHPNEPVARITLICMGHEPDLGAHLEKELRKICNARYDIKVFDVLLHKANLEFKQPTEALVRVADGKLTIDQFYPLNLMQKLSLDRQTVGEWRELVDSVMIDWNYDGSALSPDEVDVPEDKAKLVKGTYAVPATAGTIRVKITDILSDSWEETVGGVA